MKKTLLAATGALALMSTNVTPASAGVYFSINDMMSSIDGAVREFSADMNGSFQDTTARAGELPLAVLPLTAIGTLPTATMLGGAGASAKLAGKAMTGAGNQVLDIMKK